MPHRRITRLVLVLLAVSIGPGAARAQTTPPSVAELRRAYDTLSAHRPDTVSSSVLESVAYTIDVAERCEERHAADASVVWRRRAASFLGSVRAGRDPFPEQRDKIVSRGYASTLSTVRQGYSIYLPPHYDPTRAYPLMIVLHGGSSNGNLFLGVVLGNNMDWLTYNEHLWDEFTPRWSPDWIVVAPDGFGQVLWRWMGEQDVMDVLHDVERNYRVDTERVVLCGLSNGAVGAYSLGERHASEFSAVLAIAGAPTWRQYASGRFRSDEEVLLDRISSFALAENAFNTSMRTYHGHLDPGPMRPQFYQEFVDAVTSRQFPIRTTWFDAGHDLLYVVHRHGLIFDELARVRRVQNPSDVHVVTGDYRANRQRWLSITRIDDYPHLARATGSVTGDTLTFDVSPNTSALEVDVRAVPFGDGDSARITIGSTEIYRGPRSDLGHRVAMVRRDGVWQLGVPDAIAGGLEKRPGLAGPITDAYYGAMIHVYGTRNAEHAAQLRSAAERGSHGWPLWLWNYEQRVVRDVDVTDEMMRHAHVVVYGSPGDNALLERMASALPVHVDEAGVSIGGRRFEGSAVGVKFVYPNPLAPDHYVIVQEGVTPQAVSAGYNLPDFVPDYLVYNQVTTQDRPRLTAGQFRPLAAGFFDSHWQLPETEVHTALVPESHDHPVTAPVAPPVRAAPPRAVPRGERAETTTAGAPNGAPAKPTSAEPGEPARKPDDDARNAQHRSGIADAEETPERPSSRGGNPLEQHWGGNLPIPVAPPQPPATRRFLAPASDPAGIAARFIATHARQFRNYRAEVAGATWTVDPDAVWQIRSDRDCMRALRAAHVAAHLYTEPLATEVPTPVELGPRIDGIEFRSTRAPEPIVMSCEMAVRLPVVTAILRAHGVTRVEVLSAYRDHPATSFHTFGLALDMSRFSTAQGELVVTRDFLETPDSETCSAPAPSTEAARTLLAIACDLAASHQFSSVLTPNYNSGHRNHFHLDARPDDPRLFVR